MIQVARSTRVVAGLDPSLCNTAVCAGAEAAYECRTFSSKLLGQNVAARIARFETLTDEIVQFIRQRGVQLVCIEGYSYGSNTSGHHSSVEFGGILRYKLLPHCAIYEVVPTTLKKFATGSGKGKKVGIISALSRKFNLDFDTDDEYDAFGLYRLALCVGGTVEPANRAQAESIKTVLEARNGKKG